MCGGAFMTTAGYLFSYVGGVFTWAFVGSFTSLVACMTQELLQIVAVSMPALAITMILTGGLRGAGDTRWPLAITFAGYLFVRIPGAYFFAWSEIPIPGTSAAIPALGWGVHGAWVVMVGDTFFRAALVLARYLHGGWTRVKV